MRAEIARSAEPSGDLARRYLYVAIDRASRRVHLAVKDEETEAYVTAFPKEAVAAFPFKLTHLLTDRGSCFTADGFEAACRKLGVQHRKTKPYTPQTNGLVERFNDRIGREVLVMCIDTHDDLERLLHGCNLASNTRRHFVRINGQSPGQVVKARREAKSELAKPTYQPPNPCDRTKTKPAAQLTVYSATDESHPDTCPV